MAIVRFSLDKTSAGLLRLVMASKDNILTSIRNNTFTLEETQSLADFLIRADHHKDFNIRASLIKAFVEELLAAFKQTKSFLNFEALYVALAYYHILETHAKPDVSCISIIGKCSENSKHHTILYPFSGGITDPISSQQINSFKVNFLFALLDFDGAVVTEFAEKIHYALVGDGLTLKMTEPSDVNSLLFATLNCQYVINENHFDQHMQCSIISFLKNMDADSRARNLLGSIMDKRLSAGLSNHSIFPPPPPYPELQPNLSDSSVSLRR